jgi:hypothetical protein
LEQIGAIWVSSKIKKARKKTIFEVFTSFDIASGGERGIRTPGGFHLNGFQDRRIRPLCHLSGRKIRIAPQHHKMVLASKNSLMF